MTTDNTTISRAALGKIVGALDQAKRWHQGDKWRDNSTIEERAAWEDHLITLDAALTEARAAMDAQGEAEYFGLEPWERPANVPVATMIFPKHSPTKPFVALGDCAKFYPDAAQCKPLYTNPQATEPAQSSNPSGEHSEPSLLGSEPAPSTAGERSELLKALSENRLHYSDQSTLAALLQSTALPVGELMDIPDSVVLSAMNAVGDGPFGQDDYDETRKCLQAGFLGMQQMLEARAILAAARSQPVREPLSEDWIRERCSQSWVFETAKQWIRMAESAHGIK